MIKVVTLEAASNQKVNHKANTKPAGMNIAFLLTVSPPYLTITCSCCPYLYFGSAIMLVTYFVNFR